MAGITSQGRLPVRRFFNLRISEIRKSGGEQFMAQSFSPNLVALGGVNGVTRSNLPK